MTTQSIDIYVGDSYYGSIRMRFDTTPFVNRTEDIERTIEQRLPYLKGKQYRIVL